MKLVQLFYVVLLGRSLAGSLPEAVVYPRILESRSLNGRKLLHVQEGLVLELEKASILGENFVYMESIDGQERLTQVKGRSLEGSLFQDAQQMASLTVDDGSDGLEVHGILSKTLRIAPHPVAPRSTDGQMAHLLFSVEELEPNGQDEILPELVPEPVPKGVTLNIPVGSPSSNEKTTKPIEFQTEEIQLEDENEFPPLIPNPTPNSYDDFETEEIDSGEGVTLQSHWPPETTVTGSASDSPLITRRNSGDKGGTRYPHWPTEVPVTGWGPNKPGLEERHKNVEDIVESRRLPESVTIEVFVISAADHNERFKLRKLIMYIAVFMNAVNLRYASCENPKLVMRLVGIKKSSSDPYYREAGGVLIAGDTLNELHKALPSLNIPGSPDVIYLITSKDLASVDNGKLIRSTSGLAYIGTVCNDRNVGEGEDKPYSFNGVHVAAHEIAHILGSKHDGSGPVRFIRGHPGALACPWKWGYIMSYIDGGKKHFRFSECSQAQIRAVLRLRPTTCLEIASEKDYLSEHPKLPGGLLVDIKYCKLLHPKLKNVEMMSVKEELAQCKIRCGERRGFSRMWYTVSALDGMSCGEGRTCRAGVCREWKGMTVVKGPPVKVSSTTGNQAPHKGCKQEKKKGSENGDDDEDDDEDDDD